MDIYIDRIKRASFANRKKAKGKINNRLVGINLARGKEDALQPIYMATLAFEKIGNVTIININLKKPWMTIVLMPSWPFVVFVDEAAIALEEE